MSLAFFKVTPLVPVLRRIAEIKQSDRDFWLRSEDFVLRMKNQLTLSDICELLEHVYSKVNASHLFWMELETLVLARSSDFRKEQNTRFLLPIVRLFSKHG
jgi:hypothetical protein